MNTLWILSIVILLLILNQSTDAVDSARSGDWQSLSSKVDGFRINLHRMLEGSRVRKKRQIAVQSDPSDYQMRVGNAGSFELPYLSGYNLTFWTPVRYYSQNQVLVGTQDGHLILFEISQSDDSLGHIVAASYEKEISIKAKAFTHFDEQWFIVLQSARNQTWIRLYLKVGRGLEQRQVITLEGETDFDLVTTKGVHYMAVSTYQKSRNVASLSLYHWIQTQLDLIATRTVYGPRSIVCWAMDGTIYIVLAQRIEGEEFRYGSPVYLYNARDERGLVLEQMLSVYGPVKVLHFSINSNHYVIFIGSQNAAVYWWSSNQFLLWQSIKNTAYAIDAAILSLENGEVLIVIALKEEILFATLDSSGEYAVTFTMSFSGYSLSSVQFMYSGQAYYALALFAESYKHRRQETYKVTLGPQYNRAGSSLDVLSECLNCLSRIADERQVEMNHIHADLSTVWVKNREQKITAQVFVEGKTSSDHKSIVTEILVVTNQKISKHSLPEVNDNVTKLKSFVESIQHNVGDSVRKSVQQNITGSMHFYNPVFIPSFNLKSTSLDLPINGVPVSRIDEYALRQIGDQTFSRPINVDNMHGSNISTEYLNGIKTDDFLMLNGQQHVTGNLEFLNTQVNDLHTDTVNSIPVNNFVTKSGEQTLSDLKSISNMKSDVISVKRETNGEILSELVSKIVRKDTDSELKESCSIYSLAHINGDIFLTGMINGYINLGHFIENSVTKHTQQELRGHLVFGSSLNVEGDLRMEGNVNGINLGHLLTLSTDQIIGGQLMFENLLEIQNELTVASINGINLRANAVLKTSEPQFVTGLKTFARDIISVSVDMTDYVTLDGIDPSLLVQDIVKHAEGKIKENRTIFHKVTVLGNLTVVDGINKRDIFDLPGIVWLKTTPQVIEELYTKEIVLQNDMVVQYINTIHLDTDVVRSYGDETIISVKYFDHKVDVSRTISVTDGAMINGVDILSCKIELDEYFEEGTIHGKKILGDLEIYGDLNADTLNKYGIFLDIMRPHDYQVISVPVTFSSNLMVVKDTLQSDVAWFKRFNGIDLQSTLENSLSRTKPNQIITKKVFSRLQALNLFLPIENTINGIPFDWLLNRTVTLNTPQQVIGEKTFLGDIDLQKTIVVNLNGRELSSLPYGLVFTDDKNISSKEFTGSIKVPNLFIRQPLNGIDIIQLSENMIDKSKDISIKFPITFLTDIDVGKLVTAFTIDETDWDDLVFTKPDESLDSLWLMTSVNLLGDVFTTGKINDCDLVQLKEKALYSIKSSQLIQEEITIESIEVIGNVNIDMVNEVPVGNLLKKLVLVTGDQIVTSDVILGNGIKATNINMEKIAADMNLPFLINDAVKSSVPQDIRGYKRFNSLKADILEATNLFIRGQLDSVNVNELYNNIVWKQGYQIIEGEKIFTNLKTDVATVQDYLNGLRVPDDIVRTDEIENITSPVVFMSDVIFGADLLVGGEVDGINLPNLLQNRVTLATDQNVPARFTFYFDAKIEGNMKIDGTVNDVVLELVSKTSGNIPFNGYKVFVKDFYITESLNASSVNGYNVQMLDQSILKRDEEEFINDLQVFEKTLKVESHLFTDWINGISMTGITSTFFSMVNNFNKTLNYLEELSYIFLKQLTGQIDKVGNGISKFAYFILLQEINLGPTLRILQGYRLEHSTSEFSHSMVIWTSQKHCSYLEKCCHEEFSHWMRVKKSGHLMIDSQPEPGRLHPIHNPAPVMTNKDFFIWTNATGYQPKWCNKNKDEKMLLASFTDQKYMEVFMDIRSSATLSDLKSFRQGYLYTVAGFYYNRKEDIYSNAIVYKFNEVQREWTEHQILPSLGVLSLDITHFGSMTEELLLAVGTGIGSYSSVYKWDDVEHEFILLKNIPSKHVTSTIWLKHGPTQLLAMANVEEWPSKEAFCSDLVSGGGINIYTYDKNIKLIQNIPLSGVISMVSFTLEGDTFLAAASIKHQTIYIYEWRGYSGFDLIQSMYVGEITHLNTYRIDNDLYMTVATFSGPAKVLKVVVQGQHTVQTSLNKDVLPDQKDEAMKEKKVGC